jgi:hypothetical protein
MDLPAHQVLLALQVHQAHLVPPVQMVTQDSLRLQERAVVQVQLERPGYLNPAEAVV